jgi:hypothetical protein
MYSRLPTPGKCFGKKIRKIWPLAKKFSHTNNFIIEDDFMVFLIPAAQKYEKDEEKSRLNRLFLSKSSHLCKE